jgi:hypothetical protein
VEPGSIVSAKLEGYRYFVDIIVIEDIDSLTFRGKDPEGNEGVVPKAWIVDTKSASTSEKSVV